MPFTFGNDIWDRVGEIYAGGTQKVGDILEKLASGLPPDAKIPSDRQVYRYLADLEGNYTEEQRALDQPWQLRVGLAPGIQQDDIPILMNIGRILLDLPLASRLTIRTARWVSVIRRHAPEWPVVHLWQFAAWYSYRERAAATNGKADFDTADLDVYLMYAPWRSDEKLEAYRTAIDASIISQIPSFNRDYPYRCVGFSPGPLFTYHPVEIAIHDDPSLRQRYERVVPPHKTIEEEFYARRKALESDPTSLQLSSEDLLLELEDITLELSDKVHERIGARLEEKMHVLERSEIGRAIIRGSDDIMRKRKADRLAQNVVDNQCD